MFKLNQLVAVRAAAAVAALPTGSDLSSLGESNYGRIGRVTAITPTGLVTMKSADGVELTITEDELIPVVHYDINEKFSGDVGEPAYVTALDHPIWGREKVITSTVQFILDSGEFETRNTLYIPNAQDILGIGVYFASPYLTGEA